jgi:hypothetical protein
MRKGRYRKNLLTEAECLAFARQIADVATELFQKHQTQQISDPELTARFVLASLKIIRPRDWFGSRIKSGTPATALETFEHFVLRGLPLSVNRSLIGWSKGQYPLQLFFEVPSIDKVLALQSQGVRCVTVLLQEQELSQYVMQERDPVSFTLHDLIHADHFFRDPRQAQVQIGFSRWLSELWAHQSLRDRLQESTKFAQQFEYACADMNSHGAHLVKYLKAIFCQNQQQDLLLQLASQGPRSPNFQSALDVLNTPNESSHHLQFLEEEFLQLGKSTNAQNTL